MAEEPGSRMVRILPARAEEASRQNVSPAASYELPASLQADTGSIHSGDLQVPLLGRRRGASFASSGRPESRRSSIDGTGSADVRGVRSGRMGSDGEARSSVSARSCALEGAGPRMGPTMSRQSQRSSALDGRDKGSRRSSISESDAPSMFGGRRRGSFGRSSMSGIASKGTGSQGTAGFLPHGAKRQSKEWAGFAGLSTSSEEDDDVEEEAYDIRQERYAQMQKEYEPEPQQAVAKETEEEDSKKSCWLWFLPVFFFCAYNSVDFCAVYLIARGIDWWLGLVCLVPACIFLIVIEICLAWTDRDIARIRYKLYERGSYVQLLIVQAIVVVIFGCCYGYHLLRAYRNLRHFDAHRSFLTQVEALDPSRQAFEGVVRWDSWDVVWGPPVIFALTGFLAQIDFSFRAQLLWSFVIILASATFVGDLVYYDMTISHHIRTQYGTVYDKTSHRWVHNFEGKAAMRRFQIEHHLFRSAECSIRLFTVLALAAAANRYPSYVMAVFVLDFATVLLTFSSVSGLSMETAVMSVSLIWADVLRFVDEPGFVYLANFVSLVLKYMRFGETVLAMTACLWMTRFDLPRHEWRHGYLVILSCLLVSIAVYLLLYRTTQLGITRDDIFSAIARGDVKAVEQSLEFDGGCEPDMKMCTMARYTPLGFAVLECQLECIEYLMERGADCSLVDSQQENPIHYAANTNNEGALTVILEGTSFNPKVLHKALHKHNCEGHAPRDLATDPNIQRILKEEEEKLAQKLEAGTEHFSHLRSRTGTHQSVASIPSTAFSRDQDVELGCASTDLVMQKASQRTSIYGEIAGGHFFHVWVGPRKQFGRMELPAFMVNRGIGEQAERLFEHISQRRSNIRLAYLTTVSTLGAGGFGRVLKVQDVRTGIMYALKLQKKDKAMKQAVREARELSENRHPNIVGLVHIFHTLVFYGILMEFCEKDLNMRIIENSKDADNDKVTGLSINSSARYTACVTLALEHLHEHKVVFRDLKPENVLITSMELGDKAKLADFGMAKKVAWANQKKADRTPDNRLTMKAGTLAFLSGEAITDEDEENEEEQERNMDWYAKRDWYGLGCCVLLMLLGERGGRKLRHGGREVLLPAPQEDIDKIAYQAWDEDVITDDVYDLVTSLTKAKARDRWNSINLRNSALLGNAILELEPFPIQ